jgi:hypothetical protein
MRLHGVQVWPLPTALPLTGHRRDRALEAVRGAEGVVVLLSARANVCEAVWEATRMGHREGFLYIAKIGGFEAREVLDFYLDTAGQFSDPPDEDAFIRWLDEVAQEALALAMASSRDVPSMTVLGGESPDPGVGEAPGEDDRQDDPGRLDGSGNGPTLAITLTAGAVYFDFSDGDSKGRCTVYESQTPAAYLMLCSLLVDANGSCRDLHDRPSSTVLRHELQRATGAKDLRSLKAYQSTLNKRLDTLNRARQVVTVAKESPGSSYWLAVDDDVEPMVRPTPGALPASVAKQ